MQILKVQVVPGANGKVSLLIMGRAADGQFLVSNVHDIDAINVAKAIQHVADNAEKDLAEQAASLGEMPY